MSFQKGGVPQKRGVLKGKVVPLSKGGCPSFNKSQQVLLLLLCIQSIVDKNGFKRRVSRRHKKVKKGRSSFNKVVSLFQKEGVPQSKRCSFKKGCPLDKRRCFLFKRRVSLCSSFKNVAIEWVSLDLLKKGVQRGCFFFNIRSSKRGVPLSKRWCPSFKRRVSLNGIKVSLDLSTRSVLKVSKMWIDNVPQTSKRGAPLSKMSLFQRGSLGQKGAPAFQKGVFQAGCVPRSKGGCPSIESRCPSIFRKEASLSLFLFHGECPSNFKKGASL